MKKTTNQLFENRLIAVFALLIILTTLIVIRLMALQVFGGKEYKKRAAEQRMNTIQIKSERGIIYDRNHNVLASNVNINSLYVAAGNLSQKTKRIYADRLASVLDMSAQEVYDILIMGNTVKIYSNLTLRQIEDIKKLKLVAVTIVTEPGRNYPKDRLAASVLGFTNKENAGSIGIEYAFNEILQGKPGLLAVAQSLNGESEIPLENSLNYRSTKGNSLITTIDETIQSFVINAGDNVMEKYKPKNLSIVVMNPNNGEILAMQNFPGFNPNQPKAITNTDQKKTIDDLLKEDQSNYYYNLWKNGILSYTYEPGSVFKVITTASALEENTTSEQHKYFCDGFIKDIPGITIRCNSWANPEGNETLQEAFNTSCNVAYVHVARELSREKFYKYIDAFGFGKKTGVKLPSEQIGLVPKNATQIDDARLATMSYGHGISVTPIEMITALNAVVNGGYIVTPQIAKQIIDPSGKTKLEFSSDVKRQVISNKTSKRMSIMLQKVIDEGASKSIKIPGYPMGGKSGTTIKLEDGKYTSSKTVASFFASYPTDHPEYTILVVCDEPKQQTGGSAVAGVCSREIMTNIIKYKNYLPAYNVSETLENTIKVPNVVGLTLKEATNILSSSGFKLNIINSNTDLNTIVKSQSPEAFKQMERGTIVELTCDDTGGALIQMPNIIDLNVKDGIEILHKLGLSYKIKDNFSIDEGKLTIKETNPMKGTLIEAGTKVQIVVQADAKKGENE